MFINKIRTNIYRLDKTIHRKLLIIPNQLKILNNYYYKYNQIIFNIKTFSIWKFVIYFVKKKIKNIFY